MKLLSIEFGNVSLFKETGLKDLGTLNVVSGGISSGKSLLLKAMQYLRLAVKGHLLLASELGISNPEEDDLEFKVLTQDGERQFQYYLKVRPKRGNPVLKEELIVDGVQVLFCENGKVSAPRQEIMDSPSLLALSAFRSDTRYPFINMFHNFVSEWFISDFAEICLQEVDNYEPEHVLAATGNNLNEYLMHLYQKHPETLKKIVSKFKEFVPTVTDIYPAYMQDNLIAICVVEGEQTITSLGVPLSNAGMRLLLFLCLAYGPKKLPFVVIDNPEIFLFDPLIDRLMSTLKELEFPQSILLTSSQEMFHSHHVDKSFWIERQGNVSTVVPVPNP